MCFRLSIPPGGLVGAIPPKPPFSRGFVKAIFEAVVPGFEYELLFDGFLSPDTVDPEVRVDCLGPFIVDFMV